MNRLAIMLAVLAAATISPPVAAKNHVDSNGNVYGLIHTSGLDLTSPTTVRKLQNRVRIKANSICDDGYETTEMELNPERRRCLEIAISKSFAQIRTMHSAALAKKNGI